MLQFLGVKFSGEWPDVNRQELQGEETRAELLQKPPSHSRRLSVHVAALGKCLFDGVAGDVGVYLGEICHP